MGAHACALHELRIGPSHLWVPVYLWGCKAIVEMGLKSGWTSMFFRFHGCNEWSFFFLSVTFLCFCLHILYNSTPSILPLLCAVLSTPSSSVECTFVPWHPTAVCITTTWCQPLQMPIPLLEPLELFCCTSSMFASFSWGDDHIVTINNVSISLTSLRSTQSPAHSSVILHQRAAFSMACGLYKDVLIPCILVKFVAGFSNTRLLFQSPCPHTL